MPHKELVKAVEKGQGDFLTLVREHKEKCDGTCGISFACIQAFFEAWAGKELPKEIREEML